jgi:phage terminase Nu1 subunit (DNA packaging protein)
MTGTKMRKIQRPAIRRARHPRRKSGGSPRGSRIALDPAKGNDLATMVLITGKDAQQLSRLASAGAVVRISRGRYDVVQSVRGIIRHYAERAAGREAKDGSVDAVKANALFKDSLRKLNELMAAEIEGRVISLEDVEEAWGALVETTRDLILSLPGRIRFDIPHLTGADQDVMNRVVCEVLEENAIQGAPRLPKKA